MERCQAACPSLIDYAGTPCVNSAPCEVPEYCVEPMGLALCCILEREVLECAPLVAQLEAPSMPWSFAEQRACIDDLKVTGCALEEVRDFFPVSDLKYCSRN